MKRLIFTSLLTIICMTSIAQDYKRSSRLLAATALPRHGEAGNYRTEFIERFTYEGNEKTYDKKHDEMPAQPPRHRHLFLADPSFETPFGFSYEDQNGNTSLVYLEQNVKYAKGKTLGGTFLGICDALGKDDRDALYALIPTVHELLAHYRTLVPPDVTIDEWELDTTNRKKKR